MPGATTRQGGQQGGVNHQPAPYNPHAEHAMHAAHSFRDVKLLRVTVREDFSMQRVDQVRGCCFLLVGRLSLCLCSVESSGAGV